MSGGAKSSPGVEDQKKHKQGSKTKSAHTACRCRACFGALELCTLAKTSYANSSARGGLLFRHVHSYGWAAGPLGRAFWRYIFGLFFVTSCLQGHWGERLGGVFVFWAGCCVDSCSAARPLGRAFWRCIFGWLLAMPKLYHHYGPQGRRSWPQDGSNAAVRQPTWRLWLSRVRGYG